MVIVNSQRIATTDRKRGTLLGLAVGDALGAAVEFRRPGSFPPVTGYRAGGPHQLQPGEWLFIVTDGATGKELFFMEIPLDPPQAR